MSDSNAPELVTKRAAARSLGVGVRQIDRAINEGEVPVYDVGGWPRVRWREVLAWIEGTRRTSTDRSSDRHRARERA